MAQPRTSPYRHRPAHARGRPHTRRPRQAHQRKPLEPDQLHLRYATDPNVPWDNNPAEREIRMPKLRQKVSGCMRTLAGAENFAILRSYIATTRKHNIPTLDALIQLASGNAWMPA